MLAHDSAAWRPTRRQALAAAATAGMLALPGKRVFANEPRQRTGSPKFKFSLAAYSYRALLQDKAAQFSLSDFISDCAAMGLDGAELTSYYFPDAPGDAYLRQLKRECFLLGLDISGSAVANDFGFPPGHPERDKSLNHVKQWCRRAEILGAPVIRIFAGHTPTGVSAEDAHRNMVSGIEECCETASQHGVFLALENHGGPTATVDGLLRLVGDVHSPWFGVNLDTGNFQSATVYEDLARAAPLAINVQVKVVVSGPDGKKQPTDFARLARLLRDAQYRGYIVLEYEEDGDPREECRRYVEVMRQAFA